MEPRLTRLSDRWYNTFSLKCFWSPTGDQKLKAAEGVKTSAAGTCAQEETSPMQFTAFVPSRAFTAQPAPLQIVRRIRRPGCAE